MIRILFAAALLIAGLVHSAQAEQDVSLLQCLRQTDFEQSAFQECFSVFEEYCLESGEDLTDFTAQTLCLETATNTVRDLHNEVASASGVDPENSLFRITNAALIRALAIGDANCLFHFETRRDPTKVSDMDKFHRANCEAISHAIAYWAIIVHDRLKP